MFIGMIRSSDQKSVKAPLLLGSVVLKRNLAIGSVSVRRSVCLPVCVHLSVCLPACPSVCLSVCLCILRVTRAYSETGVSKSGWKMQMYQEIVISWKR